MKRVGSSQKCNNNGGTAKSIKSRQKSSADKCLLKVHGIGETPFLMELVPYDTIKTVRNLLTNVLKNGTVHVLILLTYRVSQQGISRDTNRIFNMIRNRVPNRVSTGILTGI